MSTDKLDRLLNLTQEIVIARDRMGQLIKDLGGRAAAGLHEAHADADRLYLELQEQVMQARMVSFGSTFRQCARIVRDLSAALGKEARLELHGEDVEADTSVIEMLREPLTHMIRNALDHGLEAPDVRVARGKPRAGTLVLRARYEANSTILELSDDGAGFNPHRIAEVARTRGLVADPSVLSEQALYQLVFEPGFSTAPAVTEVSGRGVGMDVVRRHIEALRGSITVASRPGEGTHFTIRLPLTLAIMEGFSVAVAGETYVLPMDSVTECIQLPEEERQVDAAQGIINVRGRALPYVRLRHLFGHGESQAQRENIVVVHHERGEVGFAVDTLQGAGQTVIKPLNRLFGAIPGIAGSAVLGNGRVALILDVPGLVRMAERSPPLS